MRKSTIELIMKKNNHQEQTICFGGCIEYVNILLSKNIETDDFRSLYTLELSNSSFFYILKLKYLVTSLICSALNGWTAAMIEGEDLSVNPGGIVSFKICKYTFLLFL